MVRNAPAVLVTGAAGCVGSQIVDELLHSGHAVIAADRVGTDFPARTRVHTARRLVHLAARSLARGPTWGPPSMGAVAVREGDLSDPAVATAVVAGADCVIHAAAIVDVAGSFAELRPTNLDAVRYTYEAARKAGASTFVFLSTGSVYAPQLGGEYEEGSLLAPVNDYARTKLLAEDYLRSQSGAGPKVVILRPSLVFGPRGRVLAASLATVPALLQWLGARAPNLRGGPRSNWVHSVDVARAAVFLMKAASGHDIVHGEAFNVANHDPLPLGEVANIALRAGGLRPWETTLPYPRRLLRAVAPLLDRDAIFELANRLAGDAWRRVLQRENLESALCPRFDREALVYTYRDMIFSTKKLDALGFELRFPDFASGWADAVRWYEAARWIPAHRRVPRLGRPRRPPDDTEAAA